MNATAVDRTTAEPRHEWKPVEQLERARLVEIISRLSKCCVLSSLRMKHGEFSDMPREKAGGTIATFLHVSRKNASVFESEIGFRIFSDASDATGGEFGADMFFEARFLASFDVQAGETFSETEVRLYGIVAGAMLAWPYLREFVQTSSPRLGVMTLPLPLMTLEQIMDLTSAHWRPVLAASQNASTNES